MNINEYKEKRIKELRKFFRGIHFENVSIGDKVIIDGMTPECSHFFNSNEKYRKLTSEFLNKIHEGYIVLVDTNIEYAVSKEEIDNEIKKFIQKVMFIVNDFKYTLIKYEFQPIRDDNMLGDELNEVKERNTLNTGLNFINIKIGENIYSNPKLGNEFEKENVVIEDFVSVIIGLYYIIGCIKDKKEKQEEFIDFVATNFSVSDKKYLEVRKMQLIFLNEKNYESFLQKYDEITEQIYRMIIDREQPSITDGASHKPKGK